MSTHTISPEITYAPEHAGSTKKIWKTFWILSGLTIIELILGLVIYNMNDSATPREGLIFGFKIFIGILTLAKAYYIVAVFMHLGDEIRNFIMTIVVTLGLFIWFIIAFLWDGDSWKNMRNTDAGSRKYNKTEKVVMPAHKQGEKE